MTATVGRYRLIAELAHGGMSDVFLAVTEGLSALQFEKLVVIKRLRDQVADDPEFVGMLMDEARIAARLNHPNVLQTIEVGKEEDRLYLAMEYLDGQPLHRLLARSRTTIPLEMHCTILCDVLAGLHYAHELTDYDGSPLNIVHRDATPHNVFITYDGVVKVVDFGIAKAVGRMSQTRHGVVKGKVPYMAPEQARSALVDRRTDVFAVGIMLWEAATRQRFWSAKSELQIVTSLARGQFDPSPKAVLPEVSDELDRICRRALAVRPDDRYPTAAEFERDLEKMMRGELHRSSKRELGEFVANLFADKRKLTREVIDTQLTEMRSQRKVDLVSIAPAIHVSGETPVTGDDVSEFAATELIPSQRMAVEPSPPSRRDAPRATPTPPTVERTERTNSRERSRVLPLVVIGVLALAVLGVALYFRAKANAGPAPATSVTVTLRATPLETRFSIDDGPDQENPYVAVCPKDTRQHTVRAHAPGFGTKSEVVSFDHDVSMRFALAKSRDDGGP